MFNRKVIRQFKTNQWTASSYCQSINLSYLSLCHKDVLSRIVLTCSPIINTCRKKRHDSSLTFRTIMSEFPQLFRCPSGTNQTRNREGNEHRSWSPQNFFSGLKYFMYVYNIYDQIFFMLGKKMSLYNPWISSLAKPNKLFLPIILVFGATSSFLRNSFLYNMVELVS